MKRSNAEHYGDWLIKIYNGDCDLAYAHTFKDDVCESRSIEFLKITRTTIWNERQKLGDVKAEPDENYAPSPSAVDLGELQE